jgi:hypothetical protein
MGDFLKHLDALRDGEERLLFQVREHRHHQALEEVTAPMD